MARNRWKLLSVVLFCIVLASGMVLSPPRAGTAIFAAQDATLTDLDDLDDLDQLRDLFNQRAGVPRLILLLSPT